MANGPANDSSESQETPRTLLRYIHGINWQKVRDPAKLRKGWDTALFGKPLHDRSRLVYWSQSKVGVPVGAYAARALASRLNKIKGARSLADAVARDAGVKKDSAGEQFIVDMIDEMVAAMKAQAAAADDPRSVRELLLAQQPLPQAGPYGAEGFLGDIGGTPFAIAIWLAARETHDFLFVEEERDRVLGVVRDVLLPKSTGPAAGPYVVVAHSQGSIVAYYLLAAPDNLLAAPDNDPDIEVPLLATIGSPLGLKGVREKLGELFGSPADQLPAPRVDNWINAFDKHDIVAQEKELVDFYGGNPQDQEVVNPAGRFWDPVSQHSAAGYLRTPFVGERVRKAMAPIASGPVGDFVVAADVVDRYREDNLQIPVLIEFEDPYRSKKQLPLDVPEAQKAVVGVICDCAEQDGVEEQALGLIPLKRYVAASLTPRMIETLSSKHTGLQIRTIWRNSTKKALVVDSAVSLQVRPAHNAYQATGKGIRWAVLDTGIQGNHPHFAGRIGEVWNCVALEEGKPSRILPVEQAEDPNGHGTHVAGIIGGAGTFTPDGASGGIEMRGMAPEVSLYIYKVLGDDGSGSDANIIAALDHIAQTNERHASPVIHGVNLSLGGAFDPEIYGCGYSPLCNELRRLWRQGVVVCVAAGNEGYIPVWSGGSQTGMYTDLSVGDPANLEDCIAVGSVHKSRPHSYGVSYFSSRGPTADGRAKPDCVAPGERIVSCNSAHQHEPAYVQMSGTSMACPQVSGLIAAYLSVKRAFISQPEQVKERLLETCIDLGRDRYHQGAGMPNLMTLLARG